MSAAPPLNAKPLDPRAVLRHVDAVLGEFLQGKAAAARSRGLPADPAQMLERFVSTGGKRLRPMLCVLGWRAATRTPPTKAVVRVAAALEMFHAFCLIHDDIIDNSATRRGSPTVHRALTKRHAIGRPGSLAERLGTSCALLVGDLALAWTDELLHTAGLTGQQFAAVLPVLDVMRTEVIYGQYLDVTATGLPTADLERAVTIIHHKTAKYTMERPLHVGAALAGAPPELMRELSSCALPLGEAFQLRDDLLGVFGDPQITGKSRLEDLRAGKHTALVALAMRDAAPRHAAALQRLVGNPHLTEPEAAQVRDILTVSGARRQVEDMITERRAQVLRLLKSPNAIPPEAAHALSVLAETATRRTS
ncbi:polyprenyl synthetase family protein [Streptomyces sp. NPDC048506]|uniref:polyprenyl synthetase family protein n=1 Tax=Streptomyces sp. NPDC048506 TaxID=3155028 RepID=UPI0034473F9B